MDWCTPSARMEKLADRVLHRVMYLSTKSGISFQTTRAHLDVASNCEQQSKTELKTISLSFVWSLLEPHPSKPVVVTSKNAKVKIAHGSSHVCLFSHVPHVYIDSGEPGEPGHYSRSIHYSLPGHYRGT